MQVYSLILCTVCEIRLLVYYEVLDLDITSVIVSKGQKLEETKTLFLPTFKLELVIPPVELTTRSILISGTTTTTAHSPCYTR